MGVATYTKDPDAIIDFTITWTDVLTGGDTISGTPVWSVPSGLTKTSQTNTSSTTTVWLSGGTVGSYYDVRCRITSVAGRTDDRTITIYIAER